MKAGPTAAGAAEAAGSVEEVDGDEVLVVAAGGALAADVAGVVVDGEGSVVDAELVVEAVAVAVVSGAVPASPVLEALSVPFSLAAVVAVGPTVVLVVAAVVELVEVGAAAAMETILGMAKAATAATTPAPFRRAPRCHPARFPPPCWATFSGALSSHEGTPAGEALIRGK